MFAGAAAAGVGAQLEGLSSAVGLHCLLAVPMQISLSLFLRPTARKCYGADSGSKTAKRHCMRLPLLFVLCFESEYMQLRFKVSSLDRVLQGWLRA